jgi:hypothetical protein
MGRADTRNLLAQLSSLTSLSPVAPFLSCYHLFLQLLLLYHHFFRWEAAGSRGKVAGCHAKPAKTALYSPVICERRCKSQASW